MQASLTTSKITDNQDIEHSRVLNRKQIQKRLQSMKAPQMQRVISNLNNQNNRLKKQVKQLHEKVEQLLIAKKLPQLKDRNPQIQQQVRKTKKLLHQKYEQMNQLKTQLNDHKTSMNGMFTQQMKNQFKQYHNRIKNTENEMKQLIKSKKQLEEIYAINCQAMEQYIPSAQNKMNNNDKIIQMKQENKQLKRRIMEISQSSKTNEKDAQAILDKFYHLKSEEQKFMNVIKNSKKKLTVSDMKNVDVTQVSLLEQEIQKLKKQKKQTQKQLVSEKMQKDQRKKMLQIEAKQLVQNHKEVLQRRMKAYNKLNMYQAKDRQHKQLKEIKLAEKNIVLEERASQTDKIVPKDFRKQYIGKSEGISFDDSLILDYRSQISIRAIMIYQTGDYIAFVKFYYQTTLKKRYETKIPIEQNILRKFDSKKYTAPPGCFLKSFKVSLTNDVITKVWFLWSNGQTVVQGWDMDGSTVYTADIGPQQRPISMFGSIVSQGKNSYALECLGCQVNVIENDEF